MQQLRPKGLPGPSLEPSLGLLQADGPGAVLGLSALLPWFNTRTSSVVSVHRAYRPGVSVSPLSSGKGTRGGAKAWVSCLHAQEEHTPHPKTQELLHPLASFLQISEGSVPALRFPHAGISLPSHNTCCSLIHLACLGAPDCSPENGLYLASALSQGAGDNGWQKAFPA